MSNKPERKFATSYAFSIGQRVRHKNIQCPGTVIGIYDDGIHSVKYTIKFDHETPKGLPMLNSRDLEAE